MPKRKKRRKAARQVKVETGEIIQIDKHVQGSTGRSPERQQSDQKQNCFEKTGRKAHRNTM